MFDRITSDPAVLNGQPCIRGLRLSVRRVLEALATYTDRRELFAEYPELEEEDIRQALAYAAAGFASVEDYVTVLLRRDAERVAIREGLQAIEEGRVRPIEEFERDFRQINRLTPRA